MCPERGGFWRRNQVFVQVLLERMVELVEVMQRAVVLCVGVVQVDHALTSARMGKTPQELREQVEEQAKKPTKPGHTRTAEGEEVPKPERDELLRNLGKLGRSKK